MNNKYTEINSKTIDKWVDDGWEWGQPITHEIFEKAKNNDWSVVLTPNKPVPKEWFCEMKGAKVLGLASGGGQQMPIFAALGADCTVLDYSERQLQREIEVAKRENYEITTVRADMTQPLPFEDEAFDLIFHPVSNCYIEDVLPVWKECHYYKALRNARLTVAVLFLIFSIISFIQAQSLSKGVIGFGLLAILLLIPAFLYQTQMLYFSKKSSIEEE